MAAPAKERTAYEFYRAVCKEMDDIDVAYRAGGVMLVISDLAAGQPVYVNHGFKWNDEMLERGQTFCPGPRYATRIYELMQQPSSSRILISQQEKDDRERWAKLKPIREKLAPMVDKIRDLQSQAAAAGNALRSAEEAVRRFTGELKTAESELAQSTSETAEYIAGLNVEI